MIPNRMPSNPSHPPPPPQRATTSSQIPYARTAPMLDNLKHQITESIYKENWTRGRQVVINDDTISLFKDDDSPSQTRTTDIPLRYFGIPVIPHHHQYVNGSELHLLFTSPNDPSEGRYGLTEARLAKLRSFFMGVRTVDVYLDNQIIIGLDSETHYQLAVEKIICPYFRAWHYLCLLMVILPDDGNPVNIPNQDDLQSDCPPLAPGAKVWNDAGEFSTIGTFLHPDPRAISSSLEVKNFSVSAHSFLRKRELAWSFNGLWLSAVIVIGYLGYLGTKGTWLPMDVHRQVLYLRVCLTLQEFIWRVAGRKLSWHGMVCLNG
jgi:hypothetical protein